MAAELRRDVANATEFIDDLIARVHKGATVDDIGRLVADRLVVDSLIELQTLALRALTLIVQAAQEHHDEDCVPSGSCCQSCLSEGK